VLASSSHLIIFNNNSINKNVSFVIQNIWYAVRGMGREVADLQFFALRPAPCALRRYL